MNQLVNAVCCKLHRNLFSLSTFNSNIDENNGIDFNVCKILDLGQWHFTKNSNQKFALIRFFQFQIQIFKTEKCKTQIILHFFFLPVELSNFVTLIIIIQRLYS